MRSFLEQSIAGATSFEDRFDAEVWLLDMQTRLAPFMSDPEERVQFLTLLHQEALAANLPPELVLALIEVESHFDRFAVSSAGAQGYMQVMPFWKDEIGRPGTTLRAAIQTYVTAAEFFSSTGSENRVIYIAHWRLTTAHWAVASTAIKCFARGKAAGATRRLTGSLWSVELGGGALIGKPEHLKRETD